MLLKHPSEESSLRHESIIVNLHSALNRGIPCQWILFHRLWRRSINIPSWHLQKIKIAFAVFCSGFPE
jgi:hypothetical protein